MKIDTGSPRIPLDRLKHPLKQSSPLAGIREGIEAEESSVFSEFSETFEREILQTGAKRFEKWIEKFEIK